MKNLLLSICLTLFVSKVAGQDQLTALSQQLQQISEQHVLPGFAVSIVSSDSVVFTHAFGFSDISTKKSFTPETVLNIGSVSKTFIGLAIMKAVEQGHLSLESNINDFLPFEVVNPHAPDIPIKVKHLVTHTSGITDREAVYKKSYIHQAVDSVDYKPFLREYLNQDGKWYSTENFHRYKAGERQEYSNIGSTLAAYVIESATREPFSEYTRKNIFEPLKLKATNWHFKDVDVNQHATLYGSEGEQISLYALHTYPDGGLKSNMADLSIYLLEMIKGFSGKGQLLHNTAYERLFKPQFNDSRKPDNLDPKEPNIGVFWVHKRNGEIGHTGGDPGITTFLFFNPKTSTGRVFITNTLLEKNEQVQVFSQIWELLKAYEKKIPAADLMKQ